MPNIAQLFCTLIAIAALPTDGNDLSRIHFRSGGELVGAVVAETKDAGKSYVVIKTESGSIFKIPKSKIRRVEKTGLAVADYRAKLATVDASKSSGHWEMYNWCKQSSGRSKLRERMKFHLQEIVKIDPSDDDAWRRLGEVGEPYVKVDGSWIPEEQHYASLGYVKVKGRWMPEVLSLEKRKQVAAERHLNSKKTDLKSWKKNLLNRRGTNPAEIKRVLDQILDPASLGFFVQNFLRNEDSAVRRSLYLDSIGYVKSQQAQNVLVEYAITDPDYDVRETAILKLEQEFSPESTVGLASQFLAHPNNHVVNSAGSLIGRIKVEQGIVPLIGSLRTKHKESLGNDSGRINAGFGGAGGNSFSFGEKPKFQVVTRSNKAVLQALYEITGEDFGFDQVLWRQWYVSKHTITKYNVREESNR